MHRLLVLVLAAAAALAAPASAHADRTAKLLRPAAVKPFPGAPETLSRVAATRPLTGAPTVLPVLGTARADGGTWLRVRLPERPNGSTGWISADGTRRGSARLRVVVDRSARRATVLRGSKTVRTFSVVVGKASTPTPTGSFFVAEKVPQPNGAAVGPFVLATSAFSDVLQEFDGGPGQIGLHGRTGLSGALGSASSHGCVRFADADIVWLASKLKPGSRIRVRP